jgi:hypothetical protein
MKNMNIPSIAGAPASSWDDLFMCSVLTSSPDGTPLTGSFGLNFNVRENLQQLSDRLEGNKDAIIEHIVRTYKRKGTAITKKSAKSLVDFFNWANGDQPYFYLRRGKKTIGLYRKTSTYTFSEDMEHRHRINYEFVEKAPITASNKLGVQPATFIMVEGTIPSDVSAPTVEQRIENLESDMAEIRKAILVFMTDMSNVMQRLADLI